MEYIDWSEFWPPVMLSLKVALVSGMVVFLAGAITAWQMAKRSFIGKSAVETLIMLPLVLPPTVVGFILLVMLGRQSLVGRSIEWWFGQPLLFTWWAAVIASTVVAFPLVYQTMKTGFSSVDPDLLNNARCEGANEWRVFLHITMPVAWRSLAAAYILGFARALGEFGATLMIAGNIPGKTQTVPTAIYIAIDSGKMSMVWLWVLSITLLSYVMLWLVGSRRGI
jgi:molybdate transport system permease protein